jgi:hypothetical protein
LSKDISQKRGTGDEAYCKRGDLKAIVIVLFSGFLIDFDVFPLVLSLFDTKEVLLESPPTPPDLDMLAVDRFR